MGHLLCRQGGHGAHQLGVFRVVADQREPEEGGLLLTHGVVGEELSEVGYGELRPGFGGGVEERQLGPHRVEILGGRRVGIRRRFDRTHHRIVRQRESGGLEARSLEASNGLHGW